MCSVIVINDDSTFKGVFVDMYKALGLNWWYLSCGNYKGNLVEHYHQFMNKDQAIAGNTGGNNTIMPENAKISQYT